MIIWISFTKWKSLLNWKRVKDEILGEDFDLRDGTFSSHTEKKENENGHQFAWRSRCEENMWGNNPKTSDTNLVQNEV